MTELFKDDGCFSDEGLQAFVNGELDELGRLEAAEHLSYCDKCLDRYTALLERGRLETAPHGVKRAVMGSVWVRVMQNTWGRAAVACAAAVLAFAMLRAGMPEYLSRGHVAFSELLPAQTRAAEPERLGRPYESKKEKREKALDSLQQLIDDAADAVMNNGGNDQQ